ncbi:MAG: TraV family lipoprotein [Candidatus Omnitrophica bacterium]|nr:TraV family lipoprotein [Candidatus Omnitrophota bacterium]
MRFLSLLVMVILLSGCASFDEPDFDKPLIPIVDKKESKPQEDKVWVEAKISRMWVNPKVDENGDLVEGHYKNVVLEQGHWVIKGN